MSLLYEIFAVVYVDFGKCGVSCVRRERKSAVKRNEILLIDVRHLPRHRLLPPSETVYYKTPAA